jgi:hypothetical protein
LLKFSRLFKARPPDTTLPADDRSGLEDTVNSSEMYLVDATCQLGLITKSPWTAVDLQSALVASTSSTDADPPPTAALSKAVVRTVMTLILSLGEDLTLRIAFPA